METQELRERIAAFPRWNYRFDFDHDVSTPLADPKRAKRHDQRRRYVLEPLLGLLGGTLSGRRVLDLGCNAGFWSLAAIESGAEFVLGVDLKQEYVDQANLVFEARGVAQDRYRFEQGDFFARKPDGAFDLVLCLGVMDHVNRPLELFEVMNAAGADLIAIDTEVSRARSSLFEVSTLYSTRDVEGDGMVLIPSRGAVADLARRHGFDTVALALNLTDFDGMDDYRRERRCAFICSRNFDLAGLPAEKRGRLLPWWLRDPRALTGV